jgi:hypothetical protein
MLLRSLVLALDLTFGRGHKAFCRPSAGHVPAWSFCACPHGHLCHMAAAAITTEVAEEGTPNRSVRADWRDDQLSKVLMEKLGQRKDVRQDQHKNRDHDYQHHAKTHEAKLFSRGLRLLQDVLAHPHLSREGGM